jgi:hypothetical protein
MFCLLWDSLRTRERRDAATWREGTKAAMDPDAILAWILRLRGQLDAAIEDAQPLDPDAVYTLVGLIEELDGWLAGGRPLPARWRPAARDVAGAVLLEVRGGPSNDVPADAPPPARRRRALVRQRGAPAVMAQLPLPFRAGTR